MTTKFGWCLDNHHENCKTSFVFEGKAIECSCSCHQKKGNK